MFTSNQARNRLRATTDHIVTLRWIVGVLCVALALLLWRASVLQEIRRIYIPPDLTQGLVTDFQTIPAPTIYTFTYYIFQQLNRWKTDGEKDYPQQIFTLQAFLTPTCIAYLQDDMNQKNKRGELRQRVRSIEELLGHSYNRLRVQQESANSWQTWLDVRINESINGHPVKEVKLRYPLRVVRFDVDKEINPWGLAIACDDSLRPTVLTDDDLNQPFQRTGGAP